ncbi:hypothetical protein RHMOL_Rhmol10G0174500 [Rhododendron molle]|uniref:Uncharacterized protein n=1 Tax=Rhododendron molle TaxID=49168 RepID=A0ACC0M4E4_RHOML|nr:hypothetical protein RHMOL_Rhmol10G0174500 [Rhododendron molle]
MSSSSNSNPNMSPNQQFCLCGQRSPLKTSYKEENPRRRQIGKCKFFDWVDPPTCTRGKDFGNHVIKLLRKAEGENAELKKKLQKFEEENAELKWHIVENEEEIESLMNLVQKLSGEVQQLSTQNQKAIKRSAELVNLSTLSCRKKWQKQLIVFSLLVICIAMFYKYCNAVPNGKFLALP